MHRFGSHNSNHVERGTENVKRFRNGRSLFDMSKRALSGMNNFIKKIRAKKRRNFKSDETPRF